MNARFRDCEHGMQRRKCDLCEAEQTIRVARFVADHWRQACLDHDQVRIAAHPLCMVLAALDGEEDPAQCGISPSAHDAFRAALDGTSERA